MLRVTQNAIEVVRKPTTADLRVTAYAAEVLRRPAAQCRHHRVKAVRPQPVVAFPSLGKRSEFRELH